MKKLKIYFILLLLSGFSSAFAQATRSDIPVNDRAVNSLYDAKFSPEEQALILTAGDNNPAKIDEASLFDPKVKPEDLPTEEDYGPSNARPADELNIDSKIKAEQTQKEQKTSVVDVGKQVIPGVNQPSGEKSGTITDYRNMKGSGNDQPQGATPESLPDYRAMQGSRQQPTADAPQR
jgi:hypothetical protein